MKKISKILLPLLLAGSVYGLNELNKDYFVPKPKTIFAENIRELTYNIDTKVEKAKFGYKIITISKEDDVRMYITKATTPIYALIDLEYPISNKNTVISTSPINNLTNGTYIKVKTSYTTIEDIKTEIPYATIVNGNTLCERLSEQYVQQKGVMGIKTTTLKKVFEDSELVLKEVLNEEINTEPRTEIIVIKGPDDSPTDVPQRGYDCTYWQGFVDTIRASEDEKHWLKKIMYCESGCNAESNKGYYKGLFQWDPCYWYKQFPDDNIFDGVAQIQHTLEKYRAGGENMWPACNKNYERAFAN
jgi:hypothetical protein